MLPSMISSYLYTTLQNPILLWGEIVKRIHCFNSPPSKEETSIYLQKESKEEKKIGECQVLGLLEMSHP